MHALQKTYIFAMVPHGVTAISGWVNFGTEATDFSKHFPGECRSCTAGVCVCVGAIDLLLAYCWVVQLSAAF